MKNFYIMYSEKLRVWKCYFISFKEFYSIFKSPEKILLLEHNFKIDEKKKFYKNNVLINKNEIIQLINDDIKQYPDLLCLNCKNDFEVSNIDKNDIITMNRFILEDEEFLSQDLKSIGNDFVLYTHDDGNYSCFWSKDNKYDIFKKILNVKILNGTSMFMNDNDNYLLLQKNISNGIYFNFSSKSIDYEKSQVTLSFFICDSNKDFSSAIREAQKSNSYLECILKIKPNKEL